MGPTAVDTSPSVSVRARAAAFEKKPSVPSRPVPSRSVSSVSAAPPLPQRSVSALSDTSVCCDSEPPKQFATVTATFTPSEAWQLAVAQDSRVEVLKVEDDGWAEVCYETGTRGM